MCRWDQDEALQQVFLCLDTASLKRCREVCPAWRDFIDWRVWGCPRHRARLTRQLWAEFDPAIATISTWDCPVSSLAAHSDLVVCGHADGSASLYCR